MPTPPVSKLPAFHPLVHEITPSLSPAEVFDRLAALPHCIFFDSAQQDSKLGRFSYLAADPFKMLRVSGGNESPFVQFENQLSDCSFERVPELPAFQGGAAGLFGYDLGHSWERLPRTRYNEFGLPVLAVGFYDTVIAFDHAQDRSWIIAQGWPERTPVKRERRASERLQQFRALVESNSTAAPERPHQQAVTLAGEHYPVTPIGRRGTTALRSNFSSDGFQEAVAAAIEYIHAGDLFQVNLAQRLLLPQNCDSIALYQRLRKENPAPFAGFFDLGDYQIVSASPERFLQVNEGRVETRPIKGTRRRMTGAEAELFNGSELKQSVKDRAENVMIVDLMRNDLSRVCEPASVVVDQLCEVENYQYVQHLVSAVTGKLSAGKTVFDLISASFPGGSITGAPKVRAMEVISTLEPHARGAYCGSLGYLTPDGHLDLSILIRTITAGGGWWQMPVGGGIVAQSDPADEYAETWHKAEGLLRAVL